MSDYVRFNVGRYGRRGNIGVHGDNRGNVGVHVSDHERGVYVDVDHHGRYGGHYGSHRYGYDSYGYEYRRYDPQQEAIREEIWRGERIQEEAIYRDKEIALEALERSNDLNEFKLQWQDAGRRAGVDFVYWNNEKWASWNNQWRTAEEKFVRGDIGGAYEMLDSYYDKNVGPRDRGRQPSQQPPQPQVDEQDLEAQRFFKGELRNLEKTWNLDNIPDADRPREKARLFREEERRISALVNEGRYTDAEEELNKAWDRYDQYADRQRAQQYPQQQPPEQQPPSGPTPEVQPEQRAPQEPQRPQAQPKSFVQYIPISERSMDQAWKGEKPEREDFETRREYQEAKKEWKHERRESKDQFERGDARGAVETLEEYRERVATRCAEYGADQDKVHRMQAMMIALDPSLQEKLGEFKDRHTGKVNGCDGVPGDRTLSVQHDLQKRYNLPATNTYDPQLVASMANELSQRAQQELSEARGEQTDTGAPTAGASQQRGQGAKVGRS